MLKNTFLALGIAGLTAGIIVGCGTDTAPTPPADDGGPDASTEDAGTAKPTTDAGDAGSTTPETYAVGVTVKGLKGTGLVLQNNGGNDLTVNADGTFVFSAKLAAGAAYAVTVKNQPTTPAQTCTVSGGTGTITNGNVTTVVVNCDSDKFAVGGTVSGLEGTGLVLQNNAGDDITVNANGSFAFLTSLTEGAKYDVTVKTQPTNLSQTCTVTSGAGTVAAAAVTSVSVVCVTNEFKVSGTVSGLVGSGLHLRNNGGDEINVTADGNFAFPTSLVDGSSFAVTVQGQPTNPMQTCTVAGGSGTLAGGNVTTVSVNCATDKFVIGGTVSGLEGTGLVLQNNAGDDIPVSNNGNFAFPATIEDLAAYAVTVKTQPTNKWQTCTVTSGSGNVAAANVTDVAVVCTTNTYKVKVSVTGLEGSGLVLQNNAGDDLPIAADGSFEFAQPVASGNGYLVTVLTNPANKSQTCTVTNGSGNVADTDVTNIGVSCVTNTYSIGGTVSGIVSGTLVLTNNGGDDLNVTANGGFTFTTKIASGSTYAVAVKSQPSGGVTCAVKSGGSGSVVAADVANVVVVCAAHDDGFGHSWTDGVPASTFNSTQGVAACKAWSTASGFNPDSCTPSGCGCGDGSLCAYNTTTFSPRYVWFYSGPMAGQVTNNSCSVAGITWR